jgi:tetratricopeptide (TPR) repeat protein
MSEPIIASYLAQLNEESAYGEEAADAILAAPPDEWSALLRAHPAWMRFGTFDALLGAANVELGRSPQRSLAIAQFVIDHIDHVPNPFRSDFLMVQLRGRAWKELASALYTLERYPGAEVPALAAVTELSAVPALAMDRANARYVQAQVWHELGRKKEALAALNEAAEVYAEFADAQHYLWTIELLGVFQFREQQYEEATRYFTIAIAEAQRIHDLHSEARSLNNRAQCAIFRGSFLKAAEDLRRAYAALSALGQYAEVPKAIWGVAKIAHRRGALRDARKAFEGVYASFLRLGMVDEAMRVLVELSAVAADLGGDLPHARLLCGRFVGAIGSYEVQASVRAAAEYLARVADRVETTPEFLRAIAPVHDFCLGSPSATFVPPDAMIA